MTTPLSQQLKQPLLSKNDFHEQMDYWTKFTNIKSQNHHIYSSQNQKYNQILNIPMIIISAITGTVVLSLLESLTPNMGLVVGILNVAVSVMGCIKSFMAFDKKHASHND